LANSENEKRHYVKEYLKSLKAIEEAMEPYKEQKRELKAEYKENNWLTSDEISSAVKAYRLFKGKADMDEIIENYRMLTGGRSQ
jgi:hypothetical protein